jgi:putative RNA 2'-phosphotransferase
LDRRWHLDLENPTQSPPKILFVAVRRRAHPVVVEKGLKAAEGKYIVLSPDREMALRIGRRRDQKPVLLEIMAFPAWQEGIPLYPFGNLYLCHQIPARFVNGPPVSKEYTRTPERKREKTPERRADFEGGTFVLDKDRDPDRSRRAKGRKRKGWKEEAKKARRKKQDL